MDSGQPEPWEFCAHRLGEPIFEVGARLRVLYLSTQVVLGVHESQKLRAGEPEGDICRLGG